MAMARVFGVIPTRNRSKWLEACLSALNAASPVLAGVAVVDNASSDHSALPLAQSGDERVVVLRQRRNLGCAGALYVGMQWAMDQGATHVWLLDDDMIVCPGALDALLEAMASNGSADVVLPTIGWCARDASPASMMTLAQTLPSGSVTIPTDVTLLTGGLVSAEIVKIAGLPLRRFFNGFEDAEYATRLKSKGATFAVCSRLTGLHRRGAYVTVELFSREYERGFHPHAKVYTTTRNIIYAHVRWKDWRGLGRALWRDVLGGVFWARIASPGHGLGYALRAVAGGAVGLVFGFSKAMENPPPRGAVPGRGPRHWLLSSRHPMGREHGRG